MLDALLGHKDHKDATQRKVVMCAVAPSHETGARGPGAARQIWQRSNATSACPPPPPR
jgi:hypothetical protein